MKRFSIVVLLCSFWLGSTAQAPQHVRVYGEKDKFAGWPANWGMWNWGNEVLVGYTQADHLDKNGHSYNQPTSVAKFSRSLDGGKTWVQEDAFERGITHYTWEHRIGKETSMELREKINFKHTDFAMTFRMHGELYGPTTFYYTYDRGKKWIGPFKFDVPFTGPKIEGMVARTDYIVEGKHHMTAFVTVGFKEDEKTHWRQVACVETKDGGITWTQKSWIGEPRINSIMPSSLRINKKTLLSVIRRTAPPRMVSFLSKDNGKSWTQLEDPVKVDANGHPPAMVKLKDGRLCMIYGLRIKDTHPDGIGMYAVFSKDKGLTWGEPVQIRGKDGAGWDIGYPRALVLPDGKVLTTYYYNNVNVGDKFRYIAATIIDPSQYP
jgi:hypothetical protein